MSEEFNEGISKSSLESKYKDLVDAREYILQMNNLYEGFFKIRFDLNTKKQITGIFISDFGSEKNDGVFFQKIDLIQKILKVLNFDLTLKRSSNDSSIESLVLVLLRLGDKKKIFLSEAFGIEISSSDKMRNNLTSEYHRISSEFNKVFNTLLALIADQLRDSDREFIKTLMIKEREDAREVSVSSRNSSVGTRIRGFFANRWSRVFN